MSFVAPSLAPVMSSQMSAQDKLLLRLIDQEAPIAEIELQIQVVHQDKKSSINHTTVQTQSALFRALKSRRLDLVDLLLRSGADAFRSKHAEWVPMLWCLSAYYSCLHVREREQEALQIKMIEYGFAKTKRNLDFFHDKRIENCLHYSLANCTANVSVMLYEYGADIARVDHHGYTPLHYAVSRLDHDNCPNTGWHMKAFIDRIDDDKSLWHLNTKCRKKQHRRYTCENGGYTFFEFLLIDILPQMEQSLELMSSMTKPEAGTVLDVLHQNKNSAVNFVQTVLVPDLWRQMVLTHGYIDTLCLGWCEKKQQDGENKNQLRLLDENILRMIIRMYESSFSNQDMIQILGRNKTLR
jgi:hypothetical protein